MNTRATIICACAHTQQVSFSLAPIWMFLYSEGKDVQNEMSCFEFQVYSGRLLSHAVKESSYYLCYSDKVLQ